jgi:hypothetical protein
VQAHNWACVREVSTCLNVLHSQTEFNLTSTRKTHNTFPPGEPGSSVSIVCDYGLDGRGSIPDREFFWLWGPRSLLHNEYQKALLPGGKRGRGMTLTTHPLLVPRLRKSMSYISPQAPKRRIAGPLYFTLPHVFKFQITSYDLRYVWASIIYDI